MSSARQTDDHPPAITPTSGAVDMHPQQKDEDRMEALMSASTTSPKSVDLARRMDEHARKMSPTSEALADSLIHSQQMHKNETKMSPTSEALSDSLMHESIHSSPLLLPASMTSSLAKLTVSPQTIPESQTVDHSIDEALELPPADDGTLSRNTSTRSRPGRSMRVARRQSRRSTSYTSNSPAHTFLSSWHRDASVEPAAEAKPDDEGQAIGLNSEYIIGRTISSGGFAVVKEVRTMSKTGQQAYAVKIVRKTGEELQDLEHEVSVWRHLVHPHILQLRAVYDTDYATFCVMDLNVGVTLFDLVHAQRRQASNDEARPRAMEPRLAKRYAYQLASALRYLHEDIRVCHRDIKLENCLVDTSRPDYEQNGGNLRLCDFGLADFLHSGSIDGGPEPAFDPDDPAMAQTPAVRHTTSSVIGTLEYASPRGLSVNRKLFETAGDVWAYGVVVYALCTGDLPFRHPMPSKTVDAILRADWDGNALRQASEEVNELVRGCLEKDIDLRWTIGDCIASPWFDGLREEEPRVWKS